ncbi:putative tetratricopeptide-like helical domain superfamily [Helianthus annuus]|uniref:Putative 43kDa postsynaptic protein, N-acetyltransferase B complex, non-catalytic subunit n=1 Tax=Helianthus annuus TaxID=4232 RepID=A0A251U7E7_HELAN|nr:N-terminal acetyltransferase B complex auxiliary subunit NAA25 isoform X2 [Helianthus annuus]KAJ0539339.1 putative tetratricopeptide-like helical domain superfamily [Helianthus annuus]KAJ0547454.1 putative tetratricopeptide-like helical domain superfamily [Helianthus annuus]KAJ0554002.1 putative tetratricopeptide-like helical domain superfamily [Helianthus annuus]KAJ0719637.1 putative tetratricopeptide-like helical domain superfamily [Helianthus annuus]KAJ0722868.1 putative tetratricopeptid
MASKFGMAGGIPERRVRPVWDAIDSRQFKNALKLSTALLSKYPNSSYALALKALILERMGKTEEALSVCINAKDLLYKNDSLLIDDLTLSTLQIVFQRLDHLDMATSCYEYACGKFPNNLELMTGLFNCYVREYSFVKQQQIAIKMYKIAGEERFLLWAVCSIQLQVLCGNGEEKLLQLAEGLLKKHIASHSLHEPEALSVYISLLEQQAKYGDALEILSGNLGSLMMIEVDKLRIQGRLLARAGDFDGAADIFQKVLKLCPDDWECFHHYLGCLLEDDSSLPVLTKSSSIRVSTLTDGQHRHIADDKFDICISKASDFVENLMTEVGNDSIRGPGLANLEIERRKIMYGRGNAEKLMGDLVLYFSRFGHLASFTADVEVFLQILPSDMKKQLLEKLVKCIDSSSTPSRNVLGQHITFFKIRELIGDQYSLPVEDLVGFAVQMTEMYCRNLPLSKDLDVQESMYGEELLSMTCNVLVQLFWRTKHVGYLLEAITVLELGLTVRRYVWQYKILLLHLYSYWNALPLAYEWYKLLDVKNILLETVSHLIFPQMLASSLLVDTNDLLKGYLRFMDDHFRESADLTFLAYRHRNYSKVIEFVQFKERLQRSNQYLTAKIEGSILQLKRKANSIEEAESVLESLNKGSDFLDISSDIRSKKLTFNEDLKLRPWWTPSLDKNYLSGPYEDISHYPKETADEAKQTEAKLTRLEKRSLLPRMIYLSIQCASSSTKGNSNVNGFDSKDFSELKSLLESYSKFLGFPFLDAAELVISVSHGQKSLEEFSSNLIDWINFAVFLNAWNLNPHETNISDRHTFPINWQVLCRLLEKCISEKVNSTKPLLSSPGADLSILIQLVTEPLSWLGLIIQSCVRSSLPSGKKKKKGGPSDQSNSQLSNTVKESITSLSSMIDIVAKWLKEQIDRPIDTDVDFLLTSVHGEENDHGPGKVVKILETLVLSVDDLEVGDRVNRAIRSWKPVEVARKIVTAQGTALTEFFDICESKLKVLQALKGQIQV